MERLNSLVEKAKHSSFYMWLLNVILLRTVPFNKPHSIKVIHIGDDELTMRVKNTKPNQNHIRGIHACLLATLCEYVSGLSLLLHFSAKEYRIILKTIHMTYHYQAKTAVYVTFKISKEQIENEILNPLKTQDAIFKEFTVEVYDEEKNHICTGLINWQIKSWKNVKMKV
jgi:acyl-coenzyme A thioesterase PaaI-like protein